MPVHTQTAAASDREEVLGTFRYQGVGHVYVTMLYDYETDSILLPVGELFSLLMVNMEVNTSEFGISGFFIEPNQPYSILFGEYMIAYDGTSRPSLASYPAKHFFIGETDYFLSPELFSEIFGLDFTADIYTLTLSLQTRHIMPVVQHEQRMQARRRIEERAFDRSYYPLSYPVTRPALRSGFLDYNLLATGNLDRQSYRYDMDGGMVLLGGALRGTFFGSPSDGRLTGEFSNIHWQYGIPENRYISNIEIGDMASGGPLSQSIKGVSVTNAPIEARYFFGTIRHDGRTEPDAVVELYLNNNLVQYTQTDDTGYYSFDVPLSYGQSRMETIIYKNDGRIKRNSRILRAPYQFQPPGALVYRLTGGYQDRGREVLDRNRLYRGSTELSYGVNRWLTTRVGANADEDSWTDPFVYGGFSARLLNRYLVDGDIVPDSYYRGNVSYLSPRGFNLAASYRYFDGESRFNTTGLTDEAALSLAIPIRIAGLRVQGRRLNYGEIQDYDMGVDLSTRIGPINTNATYQTRISVFDDLDPEFLNSTLRMTLSYGVRGGSLLPDFLSGISLRMTAIYDLDSDELRDIDAQVSRRLFSDGSLQMGLSHQATRGLTAYRIGLNLNLSNRVRTNNIMTVRGDRFTSRNSARGSLGYDSSHRRLDVTSRAQVGRSAVSVVMFIDNNNSGTFDEGDEILPYNAIRISGSGSARLGSDGILRFTQLQSYNRYDMEIIERNIPNPSLAPLRNEFSFIADPNQYKPIEIPFYMTGTVEGNVSVERDDRRRGQGGVRVNIVGIDNDFETSERTFNNGDFYAMNLPPGEYEIRMNQSQLDLLDVEMAGPPLRFEVQRTEHGDFVSGIEITLTRPVPEEDAPLLLADSYLADVRSFVSALRALLDGELPLEQELQERGREAVAMFAVAQRLFIEGDYNGALERVEESLQLAVTDYALALKGSVLFFLGREEEALTFWERARSRNPNIVIPGMDETEEEEPFEAEVAEMTAEEITLSGRSDQPPGTPLTHRIRDDDGNLVRDPEEEVWELTSRLNENQEWSVSLPNDLRTGEYDLLSELQTPQGPLRFVNTVNIIEGISLRARTLTFDINSAALSDDSVEQLDLMLETLLQHPERRYEVQGHTDITGNAAYNMVLSAARAYSVRQYLIDRGASEDVLVAVGYGPDIPIADNETEEGRAENRRVEFRRLRSSEDIQPLFDRQDEMMEQAVQAGIPGFNPGTE